MPNYRPIGIQDPRFPDGRGVVLAWTCDVSNGRERTLYLFSSAQRFFAHLHELGVPRPQEFLELNHLQASMLYDRMEIQLLPFPDHLIDLGEVPWNDQSIDLISW